MRNFLVITCFILSQLYCLGQSKPLIDNIPQEKIFAHINTTFLLSGEILYYKIYCIDSGTNKLSKLSKVVYVEIINEEKKPIIKHKLRLENGQNYGDFFIPPSLSSGNYKLIAYTLWMRNKNRFYENDLLIVNPFHEDQSKIIDTISTKSSNNLAFKTISNIDKNNQYLSLKLKSNNYKIRDKVSLQIIPLSGEKSYGNFSISVKKTYPIEAPEILTGETYNVLYENRKGSQLKNDFFVPEFRGELLIGKVINKTNTPISNVNVALSIPDKTPIFKIANTNKDGVFYFNIDEQYDNNLAQIQIIGNNSEYVISMLEETPIDYNQFDFNKHFINEKNKNLILTKSINSQIENSYVDVKKDSIKKSRKINPFYGSIAKDYYLDDFKRFPTLKETFVEVIENAWISSTKGNYSFKIKRNSKLIDFNFPSLVLVDGIMIQNHNEIVSFETKDINKISIVRDQYIYGSIVFDGIISIETKEGNFKKIKNLKEIQLFKPLSQKKYFSPDYSNDKKYNRIPDYRDQLFWKPNLKINNEEITLNFYTSDNKGEYEINIEGFTNNGTPVSIKKLFYVK